MPDFTVHTVETAPEASKPLLESSQKSFGMIPNLHGVFAESPQALEGYQVLSKLVSESSWTPEERHVLWLTFNVINKCHYCVPAHTMLAMKDGVSDEIIEALRNDKPLPDAKLEALHVFGKRIVETKGEVSPAEVQTFLDAGFTNQHVMDVILTLAHKVMSNYTNHIAHTEVDDPFKKFQWEVPA